MPLPIRRTQTTIVTQANGAVARSIAGGRQRSVAMTIASASDPKILARKLADASSQSQDTANRLAGMHDVGANVFRNVVLTGGTPFALAHKLGKAWIDFRIETPMGSATFNPQGQANTTAQPSSTFLLLLSSGSGTCTVVVW